MSEPQYPPRPARSTERPSRRHSASYRHGFAFGVLSFLSVAVVTFLSTIVTARIYGVRVIGQFALAAAPAAALWVLSTAKEQAALVKEITALEPRHPRVSELFAAVFTFSSLLTCTMALLAAPITWLVLSGPLHHPDLVTPALVLLAAYALITNTAWNLDSVFSAFVAGRQLFWVRLHEAVSFLVFAVLASAVLSDLWGLILATILSSLTSLAHRIVLVRAFARLRLSVAEYRNGLKALPGLLRFGLKITPGGVAQGVSQQAGIWAIAAVSPVSLVGAYSRAEQIPNKLQQVNMRVVEVLYPTLVGRRASDDGEGFDRALVDSIRYAMIGMLLIAAVCGGAARSLLELFGPGFARATPALVLLLLFPVAAAVTTTQTQALWAVERPGLTSTIQLTRLAVTIALTLLLTPALGITGPALALLCGFLLVGICNTLALRAHLHRPARHTWPHRERLALPACYLAGFAGAHLVQWLLPSTGGLLLALGAGSFCYVAALLAAGAVNRRDRQRLAQILSVALARRGGSRGAEGPTGAQPQPTGRAHPMVAPGGE